MKHFTTLLALSLLVAGPVLAQNQNSDQAIHHPASTAIAAAANTTEGEVRKVDKAARKITLKHGEIRNLGMPSMSMVFQVQNPALLDTVQAGDKVRFSAADIKGALTVMTLEKAR